MLILTLFDTNYILYWTKSEGIYVIYEKSSKQTYTKESLSFLINKVVQTNISEKCIW